ncbi:tetratricopeptide repeat protein [Halopseudomonas salegens]|uniref:Sel1 repeat family protein n=1 Tax=Halopseudomonas salegens TaxID=1434072 RepID=A0A1H2FYR6_9GAMM|nr:tetratricopeptide repeat protein [Halopseudomonas salegens]SDU12462.1 hypothetical protein SAMN05216210_1904 [Halopseudomonas salegens]
MNQFSAPLLISLFVLLVGCSGLPERQTDSGETDKESTSDSQSERETELAELFAQPYIDPLTRYLEEHEDNRRYSAYIAKVTTERDQRCQAIAEQYRGRAASQENLNRYRRGYLYSCPDDVSAFAERVEKAMAVERQANQRSSDTRSSVQETTQRQINNCYLYFTIRNLRRARNNCEQPAAAGDPKAQHHLASLERTDGDLASALEWARLSAEQNHAPGQLLYAELLQTGQGDNLNNRTALQWLEAAATQGLAAAQYAAGVAYAEGRGTSVDTSRSRSYWFQAAEKNHPDAQLALAESLLADNTAQTGAAREWLSRAARLGSTRAQMRLAESFAKGLDGAPDAQQAYIWYSLALLGGESDARAHVEEQASRLSDEQLNAAQRRIRDDHRQMPR